MARLGLAVAFVAALLWAVAPRASALAQESADAPILINELMASNRSVLTDGEGEYNDWIELWNRSAETIDLSGWHLTDDSTDPNQWKFPEGITIGAGEFLVVFASKEDYIDRAGNLHTNFKLTGGGEYLGLTDAASLVVHDYAPGFPSQVNNQSYGLALDGVPSTFDESTPGAANTTVPITGGVFFSEAHGFYDKPIEVELSSATTGAWISYSLDGSEPNPFSSQRYTEALEISETTVLRAQAFGPGGASGVTTQTYLFIDDVIEQGAEPHGWPLGSVNDQRLLYGMDPEVVEGNEDDLVDSLTSLLTLSLVTPPENLFDPESGIYANPKQSGHDWERAGSLELIDPSGDDDGFEISAGIRIRGSASRTPNNPKHSFHLYFRSKYGDSKLAYPLFGDKGDDEFDRIDLTTQQANSWARKSPNLSFQQTMVREPWSRDTQLAMGQPAARSTYYHLYINGQYWGVYYTQEVIGEDYAATYWGGAETDYDALKPDRKRDQQTKARDGTLDAWEALWPLVKDQKVTDAEFARMLEQIDLANLADYYLLHFYGGDSDGSPSWWSQTELADGTVQPFLSSTNWRAIRDRTGGKWAFFDYGSEHSLCIRNIGFDAGVNTDNTPPWPVDLASNDRYVREWMGPAWLHVALLSHPEYVQVFRDRVSLHFGDGGVLTVEENIDRLMDRADQVEDAILAESARWGNANSTEPLGPNDWQAEIDFLADECIPERDPIIKAQLAQDGLMPLVDPPLLSWGTGEIPFGTEVALANPNERGVVWYTLDGSDPRAVGGTPAVGAVTSATLLVDDYITLTARVQLGSEWSASVTAEYVLTDLPNPPSVVLNEYNAVAESTLLAKEGTDRLLGRVEGNGGDWFELVVVQDSVDLRGWQLEIAGRADEAGTPSTTLVFANDPLFESLPAGAIIVVSEKFADDTTFAPAAGDWFINLLANDDDQGAYFTAESQQSFDTHDSDWNLIVRDEGGAVRTLRTGEGIGEFSGVSDQEVGKLETLPSIKTSPGSTYDDGSTSTYGQPNRWDDEVQSLSTLRRFGPPAPREPTIPELLGFTDPIDTPNSCALDWRPPCH